MVKDYASLGICEGCRYVGTDLFRVKLYCDHPAFHLGGRPVPIATVRANIQNCSLKEPRENQLKSLLKQWVT
jgi:hypothetical protein